MCGRFIIRERRVIKIVKKTGAKNDVLKISIAKWLTVEPEFLKFWDTIRAS